MKLKAISQAVIAASLVSGTAIAQADEKGGFELAGNVALTSDYRFRGLTQSDNGVAIQGGFDAEHESGLYAGVWASSIDFGATDNTTEFDYYAGYAGEITKDVGFDIGYIYYDYPQNNGNPNLEFDEYYASISAMGLTLGYAYSDDFFGGNGAASYYTADFSVDVGSGVALDLHWGFSQFADDDFFSDPNGGADDEYHDWSVGVSKDWIGVNWSLAYVETDLTDAKCNSFTGSPEGCDGTAILTVSKSM